MVTPVLKSTIEESEKNSGIIHEEDFQDRAFWLSVDGHDWLELLVLDLADLLLLSLELLASCFFSFLSLFPGDAFALSFFSKFSLSFSLFFLLSL